MKMEFKIIDTAVGSLTPLHLSLLRKSHSVELHQTPQRPSRTHDKFSCLHTNPNLAF